MLLLGVVLSTPVLGLTSAAQEFLSITRQLEQVQCEKRRLRREIAFAEAERRDADAAAARERFAKLDKDPKSARLEKRLAQLEPRVKGSSDPEDLQAISRQQREAFYRCE
jgi:hypothetical protein